MNKNFKEFLKLLKEKAVIYNIEEIENGGKDYNFSVLNFFNHLMYLLETYGNYINKDCLKLYCYLNKYKHIINLFYNRRLGLDSKKIRLSAYDDLVYEFFKVIKKYEEGK